MLSRINNFQYGLILLFLFAFMTACGGGGGTDSNGDGSIKISDIEGLWTIYFTDNNADTANRMQVIYLMDRDDDLYCLVEDSSEVKDYIADLSGSSISMNWNKNGGTLNLEGIVSDGKMTGTWDESNSGSGTWEAIYGLDLEDPKVTLGDGQDILLKIEEADDFGTSTYYGTDPGDGSDPLIIKTVVQMDSDELTIDAGNDGQIIGIIFAETKVSLEYNTDGSFDYEIRYKDEVTYSGVDLDVGTNSTLTDKKIGKYSQSTTEIYTVLKPSIDVNESIESLQPSFIDSFQTILAASTLFMINRETAYGEDGDTDEVSFGDPFVQVMFDNKEYVELSSTRVVLGLVWEYRVKNINKLCSNADNPLCLERAEVVNKYLVMHINIIEEIIRDIIRQEWEKYQNNEDDEDDEGVTVIDDTFENNMLGWTVELIDATDWDYHFSSSLGLVITNIEPTIINTSMGGEHAVVRLTKAFTKLYDFHLEAKIGWDTGEGLLAAQALEIILYGENDTWLGFFAEYSDNWVGDIGVGKAMADNEPPYDPWESDKLPLAGEADIEIVRNNGAVEIFWDNTRVVEGNISTPISKIRICFSYYAYNGTYGSTYFWRESIRSIKVSGKDAP